MNCPKTWELQALIDGELNDGRQEALERHLESCPMCLRKLERRRAGIVKAITCRRDLEGIPSNNPPPSGMFAWFMKPVQIPVGVMALMAVLLICAWLILLFTPLRSAPSPPRSPLNRGLTLHFMQVGGEGSTEVFRPLHLGGYEVMAQPKIFLFKEHLDVTKNL